MISKASLYTSNHQDRHLALLEVDTELRQSSGLVNILLSPTHPRAIFKLSTYSKNPLLVRQYIAVIILYWLRDYSLVKASIWTPSYYHSWDLSVCLQALNFPNMSEDQNNFGQVIVANNITSAKIKHCSSPECSKMRFFE